VTDGKHNELADNLNATGTTSGGWPTECLAADEADDAVQEALLASAARHK